MSTINGDGQSWHPVEHLAFWNTKLPVIQENAARYDLLVGDDPEKKKLLDELLSFARDEAVFRPRRSLRLYVGRRVNANISSPLGCRAHL